MFRPLVVKTSWFNSSYMISWYFWVLLSLKISKNQIDLTFNAILEGWFLPTIIHHLWGDPWLSQWQVSSFFFFGSKTRLRSSSRSNGIRAAEYPNVVNVGASPWLAHQEANAPCFFCYSPTLELNFHKQLNINTFLIFRLILRNI